MQIDYCHYHLDQPATWRCTECHRLYCHTCLPLDADEFRTHKAQCAMCNNTLLYLGATNTAQPFWERIGSFFQYPFHRNSLIMLGTFTIASAIFHNFLISLLLICVFTKYLYYVLEQTSFGNMEPPSVSTAFSPEHLALFFKQLSVFLSLMGLIGLVGRLTESFFLTSATALFVLLMLPASIIVLAMEKESRPAVNPIVLWRVANCVGWRYLIVFAYVFILLCGPTAVFYLLHNALPPAVLAGISSLIISYFFIVIFHMLGYVLFQYQGEFGYVAGLHGGSTDDEQTHTNHNTQLIMSTADIYLLEGKHEGAITKLSEGLKQYPEDITLRDRYHQLLKALNQHQHQHQQMIKHATIYLDILYKNKNYAKASDIFMDCYTVDNQFRPTNPAICHQLASELFKKHQYRPALFLLHNLHQRAPQYQALPEAYFLAAKIYSEGLRQDESALKLLRFVEQQFSTHSVTASVQEYIGVLNNIQANGSRS